MTCQKNEEMKPILIYSLWNILLSQLSSHFKQHECCVLHCNNINHLVVAIIPLVKRLFYLDFGLQWNIEQHTTSNMATSTVKEKFQIVIKLHLIEITSISNDVRSLCTYLRSVGLIPDKMDCGSCHKPMTLQDVASSVTKDCECWKCYTCKGSTTVRKNTIFQVNCQIKSFSFDSYVHKEIK